MDKSETKKVIAVIIAAYPSYKPMDIQTTVDVWARMLGGYQYRDVNAALEAYIATDTKGFPPSVGQIIDKVRQISEPEGMSEIEAWTAVRKAISNSGYNAGKEFEKLPPVVQKAVGSKEQLRIWAIDEEFNENVVSSNFMRTFRAVSEREKEKAKMPESVLMLGDRKKK